MPSPIVVNQIGRPTIRVAVNQGVAGPAGASGSGTGDALVANNLDQFAGVSQAAGSDIIFYGNATFGSGVSVSGANTGDNADTTGNAGTVTSIGNLTGPVTSTNRATAIADGALSIAMTSGLQTALDAKQATLVSGTNIKTVNGTSLLGSGDIVIEGGTGAGTVTSVALTVPTGLSVSGSPITSDGAFAISLASGYVIPTQAALDAKASLSGATFTGMVEQQNGTNPQEFRIYGTYTDGSNYRRLALKMNTEGLAQIVAEGMGAGVAGNQIVIDGLRIGKGGGNITGNTALGAFALSSNTVGDNNSAVGYSALISNTTGEKNTALGSFALTSNTGGNNSAVGFNALRTNTTGNRNSAVGSEALTSNTTGFSNSAVGSEALRSNTTGFENSAVGRSALISNTTGINNSAVGVIALSNNTTGGNNTALGISAGRLTAENNSNEITNQSVYLGADTKALASNQTNQIVIGYGAIGIGSNTAVLGNDSIVTTALKGNVGIGTTSPTAKLEVVGTLAVTGAVVMDTLSVNSITTEPLTISEFGNIVTFSVSADVVINALSYTYGTGAAPAHRRALTGDSIVTEAADFTLSEATHGSQYTRLTKTGSTQTITLPTTGVSTGAEFGFYRATTQALAFSGGTVNGTAGLASVPVNGAFALKYLGSGTYDFI